MNGLQPSFDAHGRKLKKEIAEAFVPTVNHIKMLHHVLNQRIDGGYKQGVLTFNQACKDLEAATIKEQDDIKDSGLSSQVSQLPSGHFPDGFKLCDLKRVIEEHLNKLRSAYERREELWIEYEKAIDAIGATSYTGILGFYH